MPAAMIADARCPMPAAMQSAAPAGTVGSVGGTGAMYHESDRVRWIRPRDDAIMVSTAHNHAGVTAVVAGVGAGGGPGGYFLPVTVRHHALGGRGLLHVRLRELQAGLRVCGLHCGIRAEQNGQRRHRGKLSIIASRQHKMVPLCVQTQDKNFGTMLFQ